MKKTIIIIISIAVLIFAYIQITKKTINTVEPSNITTNVQVVDETKTYTPEEIAKHNTKEDCWMIVENNVLNATEFIASGGHPNNKILQGCGKDATEMFKSVRKHGGDEAQEAMMNSKIGVIKQ